MKTFTLLLHAPVDENFWTPLLLPACHRTRGDITVPERKEPGAWSLSSKRQQGVENQIDELCTSRTVEEPLQQDTLGSLHNREGCPNNHRAESNHDL